MAAFSLLSPSLSSSHHTSPTVHYFLRNPKSLTLRTLHPRFYRPFSVQALSAPTLSQDDLKKLAADKAVEYVKSGMVLGLGTGSTAAFVVSKIGELLKTNQLTDIVGIPTSKRTEEQARQLGIPLSILDDHAHLDLAIDGADEVDPYLNLVKGRGGALLREKMVEAASDKFVVVVDETKLVEGLGGSGLAMPVEVVQFCWKYNLVRLQSLFKEEGCEAKLRLDDNGKPYVTDNSNYIVDLYFKTPIKDGPAAGLEISSLEGVVDHGLFLDMATAVIIAGKEAANGSIDGHKAAEPGDSLKLRLNRVLNSGGQVGRRLGNSDIAWWLVWALARFTRAASGPRSEAIAGGIGGIAAAAAVAGKQAVKRSFLYNSNSVKY